MSTKETGKLQLMRLQNRNNTVLEILNYGAAVFSLTINGINVVVGPAKPEDYLSEIYHTRGKHFGASVGRHAGRISGGGFKIKDIYYSLFGEDGVHIHGGKFGLTYKFWEVKEISNGTDPFVVLEYVSAHGQEAYPGNLRVQVKYTLTEANEVKVEYTAETDQDTVVNLTNHTYFNLNGSGSINDHQLQIHAGSILETDENNVPTGKLLEVQGKETDFREEKKIGKILLDTVFKLDKTEDPVYLHGDKSGISLTLTTDQPAVVVYAPEVLPTDWEYSTEIAATRAAVCLETQKFPNAPQLPNFPSAILRVGELYKNSTTWRFVTGS